MKEFIIYYLNVRDIMLNTLTGGVYGNFRTDIDKRLCWKDLDEETRKILSDKRHRIWELGNILTCGALYDYVLIKRIADM